MKNKLTFAFLCIILYMAFAVQHVNAFADFSKSGKTLTGELLLTNQPIEFTHDPFEINGELMVPAKVYLEKLGTQVLTTDVKGELIAYRDNIFIKFMPNSDIAYVNGKSKKMPVHAMIHHDELFVSASFVASAYEMTYQFDPDLHALSLNYKENDTQYREMNSSHFKRISNPTLGIHYYIPEYWDALDESLNLYGIDSFFENSSVEISSSHLSDRQSRATVINDILAEQQQLYGDALKVVSSSTVTLGEFTSDMLELEVVVGDEIELLTYHVFAEQSNSYVFKFTFKQPNDFELSKLAVNNIISTFGISKLTINERLEHYTELPLFQALKIKLTSNIYSNMNVNNDFTLSGAIDPQSNIKGFYVIVKKDSQEMDYYMPVSQGVFSMKVFTPFGLGKHNIRVVADYGNTTSKLTEQPVSFPSTLDDFVENAVLQHINLDEANTVMLFSVLNLSDEAIKELLPTAFVDYELPEMYQISNSLTFNLTNQFSKAKVIYEWIDQNYTSAPILRSNGFFKASEVLSIRQANDVELSLLYTGLLRASNIPARVIRGISELEVKYWVEVYLNGGWIVTTIADDVKDPSNILIGFNLNRAGFYENFNTVEMLPF